MRLRLLALGVGLALVFAVLTRGAGTAPEAAPPRAPRVPVTTPRASSPVVLDGDPLPPPPARDIFRYAEPAATEGRSLASRAAPVKVAPPAEVETPPPFPLRLVGLVHRSEGWRAAVATSTGVVLVGAGDAVSGFTVLGVDEDHGLRLRGPDGAEHLLEPRP